MFNLDAERAVLSSLIVSPSEAARVTAFLHAEDFWLERHQAIYGGILALLNRGQKPDFLTLSDHFERQGKEVMRAIGGMAYLTELANNRSSASLGTQYARLVADYAARRRKQEDLGEATKILYEHEGDDWYPAIVERVTTARRGIAPGALRSPARLAALAEATFVEDEKEGDRHRRFYCGFRDLDRILGPLEPGSLYTVVGDAGTGKTVVLLTLALNLAKQGARVFYAALEGGENLILARALASLGGTNAETIRRGQASLDDLYGAIGKLSALPLWLYAGSVSVSEMRALCTLAKAEAGGLDVLVVDYLQLIRGASGRTEAINQVMGELMALITDPSFRLITWAASQVGKEMGRQGRIVPTTSDPYLTNKILQDSAVMLGIGQPLRADPNWTPQRGAWDRLAPGAAVPQKPLLCQVLKNSRQSGVEGVQFYLQIEPIPRLGELEPLRTEPVPF